MSYISDLRKFIGHAPIIMPCACVILAKNGRILLQRRADDGKWGYHGGAIELFETVEDALRREVYEELGITLGKFSLLGIYSGERYRHIYPNGDEVSCIDIVYVCSDFSEDFKFTDGEVTELKWFDRNSLPENLSDSTRLPIADFFANTSDL